MTKQELRDILDEMQFSIRRDDDGDYYTVLDADKDFGHDVPVFFILNDQGDKLQMLGLTDLEINPGLTNEAIGFCNEMNIRYSYGQAMFKNGRFQINAAIDEPGSVSKEYLAESFIKLHLAVFWNFYKEVGKKFDN